MHAWGPVPSDSAGYRIQFHPRKRIEKTMEHDRRSRKESSGYMPTLSPFESTIRHDTQNGSHSRCHGTNLNGRSCRNKTDDMFCTVHRKADPTADLRRVRTMLDGSRYVPSTCTNRLVDGVSVALYRRLFSL
jgi:hypothetical protein